MLRRLRSIKEKVPNPNTPTLRNNAKNLIEELKTAHILTLPLASSAVAKYDS